MTDAIRVNGNLYSHGSIVAKVNGIPFTGFTQIDYGDKLTIGKGYGLGSSRGPRGRTRGKYETDEVKLSAFLDSGQALIDALSVLSLSPLSYGGVEFLLTVQYIEPGNVPITNVLERCRIIGVTQSNSEGPDALMMDFGIDCMAIYRNKKTLFSKV